MSFYFSSDISFEGRWKSWKNIYSF